MVIQGLGLGFRGYNGTAMSTVKGPYNKARNDSSSYDSGNPKP